MRTWNEEAKGEAALTGESVHGNVRKLVHDGVGHGIYRSEEWTHGRFLGVDNCHLGGVAAHQPVVILRNAYDRGVLIRRHAEEGLCLVDEMGHEACVVPAELPVWPSHFVSARSRVRMERREVLVQTVLSLCGQNQPFC